MLVTTICVELLYMYFDTACRVALSTPTQHAIPVVEIEIGEWTLLRLGSNRPSRLVRDTA